MIRRVLDAFVLTATYFAAGRLALLLPSAHEGTAPFWPPAGLALAALLLFGPGFWPVAAAGALLVAVTATDRWLLSCWIAAGHTLEALAAWGIVTRFLGGVAPFTSAAAVVRFAALGAALAAVVGATVGTLAWWIAGGVAPADLRILWTTWWLGDAVGIVLVAPAILTWIGPEQEGRRPSGRLETMAVIVVATAAAALLVGASPAGGRYDPLPFVPALLVVLWPVFRLGTRGTAATLLLLSGLVIAGTSAGYGPFVRSAPDGSLLALQACIGLWAVAMLSAAADVESRRRTETEVRARHRSLEAQMDARTEELRRVRDRLVDSQRAANVGSWEWDVPTNTIWWSDELYRIFGAQAEPGLSYERYIALLHPDDRPLVEGAIGKSLHDHRPFSFEHRVVRPDGSVRTIQADGHVVLDEAGAPLRMVGTGRDITDLRQADEERLQRIREQAARIEAEDANRAKDEFLATLSHELRTPLNAALGWAHLLRGTIDAPAARRRALDAILRNLQAQARLVSDMMDLSHITLRTLRLERAPVNMVEVVRGAVERVRDPADARVITIQAALPPVPVYVVGDDGRLQQVVCNLLSNAAKFSTDDGTVRVTLSVDGGQVALVVEDEGPGIEPSFLPHVFDRFRQADSSATRQHGGLGLGLAIARHLVEAHGGAIHAANRPGGGAAFTISLPAAPAHVVA